MQIDRDLLDIARGQSLPPWARGLRLLLAFAILWLIAPTSVGATPADQIDSTCAQETWNALTGTPRSLRQCANHNASPEDNPETTARAFLRQHNEPLGMSESLADLQLISVEHGLKSTHVLFQQTYDGLPVYGAYTSVHMDREGAVQVLHNGYLPELNVNTDLVQITAIEAVGAAREAINLAAPRGNNPAPRLMVLPGIGTDTRLAWQVTVLAADPAGDWEVLVDAVTGKVVKRYNRLVMARGQIFEPSMPAPGSASPSLDNQPDLQTATLLGLDDSGWLRGEYVDLTEPRGYRPASAFSSRGEFLYGPDDPRFEEVMVYYYVDQTQRYVQSLGFRDDNNPPNGIRDRTTMASAHWFKHDQSFYSLSDDALHFGDGGVEDAEDPDIIIHEYAHALQHDQLACWGGGKMEAIGEGFADYLATSRLAAISEDPACFAEWDSQGLEQGAAQCLRRVDRSRIYPYEVTGDPHEDGEIWSRVLWDLRASLGARIADTLALESHFYLPCAASLVEAGQALLDAEANLFDGQYGDTVRKALMARGLLPLPAPAIAPIESDGFLSPNSRVEIAWESHPDLPFSYDLQYSLNADLAGVHPINFEDDHLEGDLVSFGSLPWDLSNDSARAGPIDHGQHSSLLLPVELREAGEVDFRYRVDSEAGYDTFEFRVDGQPLLVASGTVPWTSFNTPLAPGNHVLTWRYNKDDTLSAGEDSVWLDDLRIAHADLATWIDAEILSLDPASGRAIWQIPDTGSQALRVRVRTRWKDLTSPWAYTTGLLVIDEPTAVQLSDFGATTSPWPGSLPQMPWGIGGLATALLLGALAGRLVIRKTR